MDPLTLGLMGVGLGAQVLGGVLGADNAQQQSKVSQDIAMQEMGINNQKRMQMQLQASRSQLENFRNVQRARAQGLNSATQQGAQFGTGLAGGQAQAQDQGAFNSLGISQNLQIGNKIADYNDAISADKMKLSQLGGDAATYQGISSLGGALVSSAGTIGKIGKGWGSSSSSSPVYAPDDI